MAATLKDVAPYPEAEQGFTRQVIRLPAQADESAHKLEILAGKTLEVDCNRQRLAGTLEEKPWKAGATATTGWKQSAARPAP